MIVEGEEIEENTDPIYKPTSTISTLRIKRIYADQERKSTGFQGEHNYYDFMDFEHEVLYTTRTTPVIPAYKQLVERLQGLDYKFGNGKSPLDRATPGRMTRLEVEKRNKAILDYLNKTGINSIDKKGGKGMVVIDIDPALNFDQIVDMIEKRILSNQNIIILIIGPTGSGKSYLALALARAIEKRLRGTDYSNARTAFGVSPFNRIMDRHGSTTGQAVVLDDFSLWGNAMEAKDLEVINITKVADIRRVKGEALIVTVPTEGKAVKGLREDAHYVFEGGSQQRLFFPGLPEVDKNGKMEQKFYKFPGPANWRPAVEFRLYSVENPRIEMEYSIINGKQVPKRIMKMQEIITYIGKNYPEIAKNELRQVMQFMEKEEAKEFIRKEVEVPTPLDPLYFEYEILKAFYHGLFYKDLKLDSDLAAKEKQTRKWKAERNFTKEKSYKEKQLQAEEADEAESKKPAKERAAELRAEGFKNQDIADKLNLEKYRTGARHVPYNEKSVQRLLNSKD